MSKQFSKFFSSYTQAFNKMYYRSGTLFDSPFKRKKIISETYLRNIIIYIHQNPEDISEDFINYKYSSYLAILSKLDTSVQKDEVIGLFDDIDNFIFTHKNSVDLSNKF